MADMKEFGLLVCQYCKKLVLVKQAEQTTAGQPNTTDYIDPELPTPISLHSTTQGLS